MGARIREQCNGLKRNHFHYQEYTICLYSFADQLLLFSETISRL